MSFSADRDTAQSTGTGTGTGGPDTEFTTDAAPAPDRRAAWAAYGRRRNLALTLLWGWLPASILVGVFLAGSPHGGLLTMCASALWLLAMAGAVWYAGEFRCPRCHRRFAAVGSKTGVALLWRGLFDPICYNCKLRKFENG